MNMQLERFHHREKLTAGKDGSEGVAIVVKSSCATVAVRTKKSSTIQLRE
jgi:hypothetical protein